MDLTHFDTENENECPDCELGRVGRFGSRKKWERDKKVLELHLKKLKNVRIKEGTEILSLFM